MFSTCLSSGGIKAAAACLVSALETYADACFIPALSLGSACLPISLLAGSAAVLFSVLTVVLWPCGKDARASVGTRLNSILVCASVLTTACFPYTAGSNHRRELWVRVAQPKRRDRRNC